MRASVELNDSVIVGIKIIFNSYNNSTPLIVKKTVYTRKS